MDSEIIIKRSGELVRRYVVEQPLDNELVQRVMSQNQDNLIRCPVTFPSMFRGAGAVTHVFWQGDRYYYLAEAESFLLKDLCMDSNNGFYAAASEEDLEEAYRRFDIDAPLPEGYVYLLSQGKNGTMALFLGNPKTSKRLAFPNIYNHGGICGSSSDIDMTFKLSGSSSTSDFQRASRLMDDIVHRSMNEDMDSDVFRYINFGEGEPYIRVEDVQKLERNADFPAWTIPVLKML